MSTPLTREQVENMGRHLREENLSGVAARVLAHDAALRAQLAAMTQERDVGVYRFMCLWDDEKKERATMNNDDAQQLILMTAQRDHWKEMYESAERCTNAVVPERNRLRVQLYAAQEELNSLREQLAAMTQERDQWQREWW